MNKIKEIMEVLRKNNTSYLWNIRFIDWQAAEKEEYERLKKGLPPTRVRQAKDKRKKYKTGRVSNNGIKIECLKTGIIYNSVLECSNLTCHTRHQITKFLENNEKFKIV